MILVSVTVALALAILAFVTARGLQAAAKRLEEDYLTRAGSALDEIHASISARAIWQASLAACAAGVLAGAAVLGGWFPAMVLGAGGALFPLAVLKMLRLRRRRQFQEQIPDLIAHTRTAVGCGYTLPMALAIAQRQLSAPASQELKALQGHLRLGVPLSEALSRLQRRMPGEDLDLFVSAINMAERAGGQLGQVLLGIEESVRERLRLERKLRTMTSRGRMEAWIIALGPVGLGLGLYLINPDLMRAGIEHPLGMPLMIGAAAWMACGYLVIRRILTPDF